MRGRAQEREERAAGELARERLQRAAAGWRRRKLRGGFRKLAAHRAAARLLSRCVGRWGRLREAAAWEAWRAFVARGSASTAGARALTACVRRWQRRRVAAAFGGWRRSSDCSAERSRALEHANAGWGAVLSSRSSRTCSAGAFLRWRLFARTARRDGLAALERRRATLGRALGASRPARLRRGLAALEAHCRAVGLQIAALVRLSRGRRQSAARAAKGRLRRGLSALFANCGALRAREAGLRRLERGLLRWHRSARTEALAERTALRLGIARLQLHALEGRVAADKGRRVEAAAGFRSVREQARRHLLDLSVTRHRDSPLLCFDALREQLE